MKIDYLCLLEVLHDHESNGLVGPVSNNVSGEQQIDVSYRDLTSLDGFAWERRRQRHLTVTDRLVGFCLLMKREVIDRVGLLDEQFEIGCFEDDDFCRRTVEAGYRAVIASHVFVHHYGSATFRGAGFDLCQIMAGNQMRYEQKWGQPQAKTENTETPAAQSELVVPTAQPSVASITYPKSYTSATLPNGEQLLQRTTIKLSLCMIVRDNEDTIEACLDSIYPWVDEIIIVDTGSTDATPEICRRFGARMFDFPWCDDFSAARNVSLEPARGEWVFWMDSDDTIDQDQGQRLRELAYGDHAPDCHGYVVQVKCPSSVPGQMTVVDHVKLIRNRPELRFEHRIHEQILPAIRRLNGDVAFTDIFVVHSGSDQTPEVRQRKLERDFRILKLDLEARPDHPFVLFNLGMTYEDAGEYEEAEKHLRRCIEVSNDGDSQLRKTWALLVNCLKMQGQLERAIETSTEALTIFVGDKELLFRRATLLQDAGRLKEAAIDYQRLLNEPADKVFLSIDPAICGHKAHHNLAMVLQQLGQSAEAIEQWELAVRDCPEFAAAWQSMARELIHGGRRAEISSLLAQMPKTDSLQSTRAIVEALVYEHTGELLAAQRVLESAWREAQSIECLDELARILVEHGLLAEAVPVLERLQDLRPEDGAVAHNLGHALYRLGRTRNAINRLERSRELRPESLANSRLLAEAYAEIGDTQRSNMILEEARRHHPDSAELTIHR